MTRRSSLVLIAVLACLLVACAESSAPDRTASIAAPAAEATASPAAQAAVPAPADDSGLALHRRLLDAIGAGDVDGALAFFHTDATVWEALGCRPNCQGHPKIREALQAAAANRWRFDDAEIATLRTAYTTWTASKADLRGDDIAAAGAERIRAGFALAARDGKIASIRGGYDQSDEPTRAVLAARPAGPGPLAPPTTPSPEGRFVDVGGRRIYMECLGDADPTVIFEGGSSAVRGAASGRVWAGAHGLLPHALIQQEVAKFARACVYDPASVGLSDPRPRPSTGRADAEDMHLLLRAAGLKPPYVVVGISYGAQVAQLFASMYPRDTAAVVLLDATPGLDYHERFAALLSPPRAESYWASLRRSWDQAKSPQGLAAGTDLEATATELREMAPLPDVPLAVLTAGIPFHPWNVAADVDIQQREGIRYDTQAALAKLAPRGTHQIVDTSEHSMNAFVPDLIVDTIRRVIAASRR